MANQISRPNGQGAIMQQSKLFDKYDNEWDDLTANVSIGFPIIGIKSGKWHYRYKGEDQIIMDAQGKFPAPAIQVVILKAQKALSRTYYPGGYVEGVNNAPSCKSVDGVRPDDDVVHPVNPVCATCPNAAWGSGATPAAPKAQACQQRRRTVLVPYSADLTNEMGGGPVLLSVPPGSLANQVNYGNKLRDNRIHYAGAVTELSFSQDPNIAFPKIEFNYVRGLTDDEAQVIIATREHEAVDRILNSKNTGEEIEAPPQAEAQPAAPPPVAPIRASSSPPRTTGVVKPMAQAPIATVASPIASAMAKPAASPPSIRAVATTPAARPVEVAPPAPPADEEVEPTPEAGSVMDEMSNMFKDIMKSS